MNTLCAQAQACTRNLARHPTIEKTVGLLSQHKQANPVVMKPSKQHLNEELEVLKQAGLLRLHGKPSGSGLTGLELLNKRLDEKTWLIGSAAALEPWLSAQVGKSEKSRANPLALYISSAQAGRHLSPHPLIDAQHLKDQLGSARIEEGHSLLYSYLKLPPELKQEISPSQWFEPALYLKYNTDLTPEQRANPFVHYLLEGAVQCRPASSRFDPYKWKDKHPKLRHTAPIIDFLLRQYSDPHLKPTRPNLPGGITQIDAHGVLLGWAVDPDATTPPKVSVWIQKKWLGDGIALQHNQHSREQAANRTDFRLFLPGFIADDLLELAQKGALDLHLRTDHGEEIGPPKGWQPDSSSVQAMERWVASLNAVGESQEQPLYAHAVTSPAVANLEDEMAHLTRRLREHELQIRTRLRKGELRLSKGD